MNLLALFSLIFLVGFTAFYIVLFKGTIYDPRNSWWSLLFYKELFFVLFPVFLVSLYGADNIPIFFIARAGVEVYTAIIVYATLLIFILSFKFFVKALKISSYLASNRPPFPSGSSVHIICIHLACFGLLVFVFFYWLGYRHALITSLTEGSSLLAVRLRNAYFSSVPSQIAHILPLIGCLLSISSGILYSQGRKPALVYLAIALFLLSARGDKAPALYGLIVFTFSFLKPPRLVYSKIKVQVKLIFSFALLCISIWYLVSLQIPELDPKKFYDYLFRRVALGNMAGLYETVQLINDGHSFDQGFAWHAVPFARFFASYTDYSKYLMMFTEGYAFTEMGVKNTYFAAEAYAMGGWALLVLSPVIVAFSVAFTLKILTSLFVGMYGVYGYCFVVPITLNYFGLTGGFASFPLFKGLILLCCYILVLTISFKFTVKIVGAMFFSSKYRSGRRRHNDFRLPLS